MASPCSSEGLENVKAESVEDLKAENVGVEILQKEMNCADGYGLGDEIGQRSNNATSLALNLQCPEYVEATADLREDKINSDVRDALRKSPDVLNLSKSPERSNHLEGQVNYSYETDSEEDFCVIRRSRSDDHLVIKHHVQTREQVEGLDKDPSSISDLGDEDHLDVQHEYDCRCAECNNGVSEAPPEIREVSTESPIAAARDDAPYDDDDDSQTSEAEPTEDRIASIEIEYIHRISALEERHYELEDVIARLTSALEAMFVDFENPDSPAVEADATPATPGDNETKTNDKGENGAAEDNKATPGEETYSAMFKTSKDNKSFSKMVGLELFIEFQQKIRHFATDLNGVLNCCEAGIRHARVVQEWAGRVQMMFENMKEERQQMLSYIDEKEKGVIIMKNQFLSELESQSRQLCIIVKDLQAYGDMKDRAEKYYRSKVGDHTYTKKPVEESIIDTLLMRRIEADKAIALDLAKQSKISEQKLFIVHQHLCIQQLQEQNRELKAIVEGLMGPDDSEYGDDSCDVEPTSTPASVSTPDQCPVREALDRMPEPQMSRVSDVLYCDRGEYLPGASTDGDIASIQAYNIGEDADKISRGDGTVFDPLKVSYVKEQCQRVEDEERLQNNTKQQEAMVEITTDEGVQTLRNGVQPVNLEAYLRKCVKDEEDSSISRKSQEGTRRHVLMDDQDAAGDSSEISSHATTVTKGSPEKTETAKQELIHSEAAETTAVEHNGEVNVHAVTLTELPDPVSPIVEV